MVQAHPTGYFEGTGNLTVDDGATGAHYYVGKYSSLQSKR